MTGRRDRHEREARVATIIEHLLKLELSPAEAPRPGWRITVLTARRAIARTLRDSPSLRHAALAAVTEEAPGAAALAAEALAAHGERDAAGLVQLAGAYAAEQVLGDGWPGAPAPKT